MSFPLFDAPWWGYVLYTLVITHITIISVTIYLHRHQTHRAVDLHPIASHFFRFWLWLTTGMVTKEWVSVHRCHHANVETIRDPHSPVYFGIWRVLFAGAELYRGAAHRRGMLGKYGHGTPYDWMEQHVYANSHLRWFGGGASFGIFLMGAVDIVLFGAIGLAVWAVQMMWIPFFAAGVINGAGHWWGYRNFETLDNSRNIPIGGFLIGGEEFHNNHHHDAGSAKFSVEWWEFDIGWMYIRILEIFGLAHVKRVAE